jgi:DNA-binding MarR family transcriptional regulator
MEDAMKKWIAIEHLYATLNKQLEKYLRSQYDLSISEFTVISFLSEASSSGLTIQQLGDRVTLSQSAISRLVARLETCHTVERYFSETDRRSSYVRLTEQGMRDYEEALPGIAKVMNEALKNKVIKKNEMLFKAIFQ